MTAMLLSLSTLPKQSALVSAYSNAAALPNSQSGPAKPTTTTTNNTNFLIYENLTSGIKIQYPSDWLKEAAAGTGVTFILPTGNNNNSNNSNPEQFLAKLNTTAIAGFPPNVPLKGMADGVLNGYKHFLPNFQLESYMNTTLGGSPAVKIVYRFTDPRNGGDFKASDTATIKESRLYVIQYYVQSSKYQSYLPTLQKMLDSFEITK
jgi:eukaryotic-like serine/threonine-protein kinase